MTRAAHRDGDLSRRQAPELDRRRSRRRSGVLPIRAEDPVPIIRRDLAPLGHLGDGMRMLAGGRVPCSSSARPRFI